MYIIYNKNYNHTERTQIKLVSMHLPKIQIIGRTYIHIYRILPFPTNYISFPYKLVMQNHIRLQKEKYFGIFFIQVDISSTDGWKQ